MKTISTLLITFLLITVSCTAFAKIYDAYQVNVIIFKRNGAEQLIPDTKTTPKTFASESQFLSLANDDATNDGSYQLIAQDEFGLLKELTRLKQSKNYTVLLALSWWQPFQDQPQGQTLHIYGGQTYNQYGEMVTVIDDEDASYYQINGTIKISLNTYFDIDTHLQFLVPEKDKSVRVSENTLTPFKVFEINEELRSRSNELHYLDNPAFGVLIKIAPWDLAT
ncbi:MAG: CsiV family protein [Gammaproteobacteria bacterium]